MRVNVYSQEIDLTENPQVVISKGTDQNGDATTFFGIRFYLHSSDRLHVTPEDDDRSAVTFWVPQSEENRRALGTLFLEAHDLIANVIAEVR